MKNNFKPRTIVREKKSGKIALVEEIREGKALIVRFAWERFQKAAGMTDNEFSNRFNFEAVG